MIKMPYHEITVVERGVRTYFLVVYAYLGTLTVKFVTSAMSFPPHLFLRLSFVILNSKKPLGLVRPEGVGGWHTPTLASIFCGLISCPIISHMNRPLPAGPGSLRARLRDGSGALK